MRANVLAHLIRDEVEDIKQLTIGEVLTIKSIFGLTDSEATYIFLGGLGHEDLQVQ